MADPTFSNPTPDRSPPTTHTTHTTHRRGLVPGQMGSFAAWVYGLAIARINRRFDSGRGVVTFDRPVISVGNLSVGGTGKTPMVKHLVEALREAGHKPCIAMRGYKAKSGKSDEAREYHEEWSTVPVIARANRVEGLLDLFATPLGETIDCIVLDDGFQHRRIARQLDIVLIDATRSPFEDRLLPAGWLREKISSLRRAHAVVITHAEAVPSSAIASLEALVRESAPAAMLAICHHRWSHVSVFQAGSMRDEPVASLRGRRVAAICAIGNPEPFFREAKEAVGSPLRWTRSLPDHDGYAENRIAEIIEGARQANAEIILATQKDWAKLRLVEESRWPCPFVIARLAIDFDRGGEELRKAVAETVQRGVAD